MSRKFVVPIQLPGDPVNPLEAVTKQYVDARAGNEVTISPTDPKLTDPGVELWYDPTAGTPGTGGPEEVFIGPDDPGSGYELWYDTDAIPSLVIANLPQGKLGWHGLASAFTTTGTHTTSQDEGLTLTINEPVGRVLKVTANLRPWCPGGANRIVYTLLRNGVAVTIWALPTEVLSTTVALSQTFTYVLPSSVGGVGVVWKLQIAGVTNTSVSSHADASGPRQLLIEDAGAA